MYKYDACNLQVTAQVAGIFRPVFKLKHLLNKSECQSHLPKSIDQTCVTDNMNCNCISLTMALVKANSRAILSGIAL